MFRHSKRLEVGSLLTLSEDNPLPKVGKMTQQEYRHPQRHWLPWGILDL